MRSSRGQIATASDVQIVLLCANCGVTSEGSARGWRAFLTGEEGEVDGVEVFCPECAEAEFGNP